MWDTLNNLENTLKRGCNTNSGNRGENRVSPICRRKRLYDTST